MKKLKKVAKIEKVFGNSSKEELVFDEKKSENENTEYDVLADYEKDEPEDSVQEESSGLTQKQIQKQNEIENVKSKISKILKSSNIEIVDENFGDEYELDETDAQKQSQQDYDALKAMFGDKDRNKKDELTLTIDDFDYTYVGKYIEEYDLMHIKNIKHIKLKNPNFKKIKKVLIAAGLVVVIGLGGLLGYMLTKQTPVTMTSVSLSQSMSTTKYYIGENFSFDGLYINVGYSNGSTKKIKLTSQYLDHIEGGSVEVINNNIQFLGGSVLMTFNYEGNLLSYSVDVKTRELSGIDVRYADSIFNLRGGEFITGHSNGKDDLIVLFDYGDYGISKSGTYSNIRITVDEEVCTYVSGKGWKVPKDTNGSTIVVEYIGATEQQQYSVEITKE